MEGGERWSASFDDDVDAVLSAVAQWVRWWEMLGTECKAPWMCPKTPKLQNLAYATNGGTGTARVWTRLDVEVLKKRKKGERVQGVDGSSDRSSNTVDG